MKKVLLSLSMLAAMMTANAQNEVGKGAYDDMATVGNSVDNPTGEYSGSTKTPAEGIYWWEDAVNASDYAYSRTGGELVIAVTKGTAYSPIGLGFGDTNGDGSGTAYTIDISGAKTLSFKAKASTGAPTLYIQVADAAGNNGEVRPASSNTAGDAAKYGSAGLTSAYQTFTYDLTGMTAATWPCLNYPTDCPVRGNAVDFTKITKVSFFINGGTAYTGTVTLDDVKIGKTAYVGLKTISSANIGSTVLFPNPAENVFTAQVNLKSSANVSITVSDMMGNVVKTEELGNVVSASKEINVAGLAKGMYTVTYILDGAPAKAEKIMVK